MGLFNKKNEDFKITTTMGKIKIDESRKKFKIDGKILAFSDLVSFELMENGSQITTGGINLDRTACWWCLFWES